MIGSDPSKVNVDFVQPLPDDDCSGRLQHSKAAEPFLQADIKGVVYHSS